MATGTATPDDATAAHQGYPPARYEELWTKSPFAVETPDNNVTQSAEYTLVGVAQLGSVAYASLIEKQNQDHILISSDKPLNGLALSAVTKKEDGTYATLSRNGEVITLKLESPPAGAGAQPAAVPNAMANAPFNTQTGGANIYSPSPYNSGRPPIRIHRPPVHIPGRIPVMGGSQSGGLPNGQPPGQPAPPTPGQ